MKVNKNQETANRINGFKLSEKASEVVNSTSLNIFYDLFGNCYSAYDVEGVAKSLAEMER